MRRAAGVLIVIALASGTTVRAQTRHWFLDLRIGRAGFSGAAHDNITFPGTDLELRPQGRLSYAVGLGHESGPWSELLQASYAGGHLLLSADNAAIEDRTITMHRLELALLMSRRVATLRSAQLRAIAGPALDHWFGDPTEEQTRLGASLGVGLRVPLGRIRVENSVIAGWSSSPFTDAEVAPGERRGLFSLTLAMAVEFGL